MLLVRRRDSSSKSQKSLPYGDETDPAQSDRNEFGSSDLTNVTDNGLSMETTPELTESATWSRYDSSNYWTTRDTNITASPKCPSAPSSARTPLRDRRASCDMSTWLQRPSTHASTRHASPHAKTRDTPRPTSTSSARADSSARAQSQFVDSVTRAQSQFADSSARAPPKFPDSSARAPSQFADSATRPQSQFADSATRPQSQFADNSVRAQPKFADSSARVQTPFADSTTRAQSQFADSSPRAQTQCADSTTRAQAQCADELASLKDSMDVLPSERTAGHDRHRIRNLSCSTNENSQETYEKVRREYQHHISAPAKRDRVARQTRRKTLEDSRTGTKLKSCATDRSCRSVNSEKPLRTRHDDVYWRLCNL